MIKLKKDFLIGLIISIFFLVVGVLFYVFKIKENIKTEVPVMERFPIQEESRKFLTEEDLLQTLENMEGSGESKMTEDDIKKALEEMSETNQKDVMTEDDIAKKLESMQNK